MCTHFSARRMLRYSLSPSFSFPLPGVDLDLMRGVLDQQSFDKILSFPELTRFVDQDPYLSKILRTPK